VEKSSNIIFYLPIPSGGVTYDTDEEDSRKSKQLTGKTMVSTEFMWNETKRKRWIIRKRDTSCTTSNFL
jgi:pyridoxine/pyridoxamine 5'-phosphate oxidase